MKVVIADTFVDSLKKLCRPWWHPHNLWYKFKCWAWKRYSTIKPRYLDHTWCDRTELLPHMMFEILSQFIENECSPGHVEWYGEYGHKITVDGEEKYARDEMQEIYDWWNTTVQKEYPAKWDEWHERMRKHEPNELFVDYCDDDGVLEYCEYNPQFDTPEQKEAYKEVCQECDKLEKEIADKYNEMMHRLINIRHYMWT